MGLFATICMPHKRQHQVGYDRCCPPPHHHKHHSHFGLKAIPGACSFQAAALLRAAFQLPGRSDRTAVERGSRYILRLRRERAGTKPHGTWPLGVPSPVARALAFCLALPEPAQRWPRADTSTRQLALTFSRRGPRSNAEERAAAGACWRGALHLHSARWSPRRLQRGIP